MFKLYPPQEEIYEDFLPNKDDPEPPLLHFGWPVSMPILLQYAKKHNLVYEPTDDEALILGKNKVEYATLSDDWNKENDRELDGIVMGHLLSLVALDIQRRFGVLLEVGRPFCPPKKYFAMFALYSNYNIDKRTALMEYTTGFTKVLEFVDELMKEMGGETKLMWWYSWQNAWVSRLRLAS